MQRWSVAVGLVSAALVAGCGGSSHSAHKEENRPMRAEAQSPSIDASERGSGSAAAYARLQAEGRHWDRVAQQAEINAKADLAAGRYRSSEQAASTIDHATREIERIARAMEGNTTSLKAATERQEAVTAQTRRENRQTDRELAELEAEP